MSRDCECLPKGARGGCKSEVRCEGCKLLKERAKRLGGKVRVLGGGVKVVDAFTGNVLAMFARRRFWRVEGGRYE